MKKYRAFKYYLYHGVSLRKQPTMHWWPCEMLAVFLGVQDVQGKYLFPYLNCPLPFHLHLHEISKFLDTETFCSTNVVKVQVSSILMKKNFRVTSRSRSRSTKSVISCPNH